jgi:DNA repair photolyase
MLLLFARSRKGWSTRNSARIKVETRRAREHGLAREVARKTPDTCRGSEARALAPSQPLAYARGVPRQVSNPPNPWLSQHVEWLEEPPVAALEVYEEEAKSLLVENDSPDIAFRWSVNPYRGCAHACAYCYARPSHQYLGFGAGTDFDRRIVVKTNAPELLARELARRSWRKEEIAFSGNTDCYQPLEASYALTRRCLEVCAEFRQPVRLITKGALVRRDVDVLARLARKNLARVTISIPFLAEETGRKLEPGASSPNKRFDTLKLLSDAGIPTGIAIAPLIPGLNDSDVAQLLQRAAECGARTAFMTLLRLPAEVLPVFTERLHETFPERARKIEAALLEMRGGRMNDPRFGARMHGAGERWNAIERLFEITCRRLGLIRNDFVGPKEPASEPRQGDLFAS